MLKKITTKNFLKIFLIIFLFTILQNFVTEKKVNAYSVPAIADCNLNDVSYTDYIVDASGLNGTLPLCFKDSSDDTLTLKFGTSFLNGATITDKGVTGNFIFTGKSQYNVNFVKNFSALPDEENETNFFLRDSNGSVNEATAIYRLTLRPATITLTANVSTAATTYQSNGTSKTDGLCNYESCPSTHARTQLKYNGNCLAQDAFKFIINSLSKLCGKLYKLLRNLVR